MAAAHLRAGTVAHSDGDHRLPLVSPRPAHRCAAEMVR